MIASQQKTETPVARLPLNTVEPFDRITHDSAVMGGKPCVRGMRITVGMIVAQIGAGQTIEELLADFPDLEREDILQALRYAVWLAQGRFLELANV